MRSTRADNAEKPGSIRAPPALPRLVNILHAVGADLRPSTSRHDPPFPSLIVAAAITRKRAKERTGWQCANNEKAAPALV